MKIKGPLEGMPLDQLKDVVVDAARKLISAQESKGPGELGRFIDAAVIGVKVSAFAESASRAELTEAIVDLELDFEHEFAADNITKLLHDSVIDRIDTIPLDDLRAVFIGSANVFFAKEQSIGPAAFATFYANKQRRGRRAKRARGAAGIPTSTVATGLDKNDDPNSLQIGGGARRQLLLGPAVLAPLAAPFELAGGAIAAATEAAAPVVGAVGEGAADAAAGAWGAILRANPEAAQGAVDFLERSAAYAASATVEDAVAGAVDEGVSGAAWGSRMAYRGISVAVPRIGRLMIQTAQYLARGTINTPVANIIRDLPLGEAVDLAIEGRDQVSELQQAFDGFSALFAG